MFFAIIVNYIHLESSFLSTTPPSLKHGVNAGNRPTLNK
jgi:hypothetical protein